MILMVSLVALQETVQMQQLYFWEIYGNATSSSRDYGCAIAFWIIMNIPLLH